MTQKGKHDNSLYILGIAMCVAVVALIGVVSLKEAQPKPQLLEITTGDGRIAYTWASPMDYPNMSVTAAEDLPNLTDIQKEISKQLSYKASWFNNRYDAHLKADYTFEAPAYNQTVSYYAGYGIIAFANSNLLSHPEENLWYTCTGACAERLATHEFCHQVINQYCSIEWGNNWDWEESFCQVFSNTSNNDCPETTMKYCVPFKTDEVDGQKFMDCVFMGCKSYRTLAQVSECYISAKLAKGEELWTPKSNT